MWCSFYRHLSHFSEPLTREIWNSPPEYSKYFHTMIEMPRWLFINSTDQKLLIECSSGIDFIPEIIIWQKLFPIRELEIHVIISHCQISVSSSHRKINSHQHSGQQCVHYLPITTIVNFHQCIDSDNDSHYVINYTNRIYYSEMHSKQVPFCHRHQFQLISAIFRTCLLTVLLIPLFP